MRLYPWMQLSWQLMVPWLCEVVFLKDMITYRMPMLMQTSLIRLSELLKKRMQRWEGHVLGQVFKRSYGELEVDMTRIHRT